MTAFEQALHIIRTILDTSKASAKADLIRNNATPQLLRLLDVNLNPYRRYGIGKRPDLFNVRFEHITLQSETLEDRFHELIDLLETRSVTGKRAENTVFKFMEDVKPHDRDTLYRILMKRSIGVGAKSINTVMGRTVIPVFEVMKPPGKSCDLHKLTYPKIVQRKLDGYCVVQLPGTGVLTKTGRPIRNKEAAIKYRDTSSYVLHAEFVDPKLTFNEISSILDTADAPLPPGLKLWVYDGMEPEYWAKQDCPYTYEDRLDFLAYELAGNPLYEVLDYDWVFSAAEAEAKYEQMLDAGEEGMIVKDPNGVYTWSRPTMSTEIILKHVPEEIADCRVLKLQQSEKLVTPLFKQQLMSRFPQFSQDIYMWEEEKPAPMVGNLLCEYNDDDQKVAGMTDELRLKWWLQPDEVLHRWIHVKYKCHTPAGRLQNPRFAGFRDDKD